MNYCGGLYLSHNKYPPKISSLIVIFLERNNFDDIQDNEFKMAIISTFKALKEDTDKFQKEDLENTD